MKRIFAAFFFVALSLNSIGQLLTEDFTYTAGQLLSANGWTAYSGVGTNALTVTSPGLTYTGHPGSGVGNAVSMTNTGEDANRTFTTATTGSVYMSFLVSLSAAQTGDYFAGVFQSTSVFPLRVYAKSDGAGGFQFGMSKSNSTVSYETSSRTFGTTYLVVVKYTFNAATTTDDVLDLWVNPALGGPETTPTIANVTGTSTDATGISAVFLRQGGSGSASTQQVDAILAGTTWAQVTPGGSTASPAFTLGTINSFGSVTTGTNSTSQTVSLSGANLTGAPGNITITAPNADFQVSSDNTNWSASATIPYTSGTLSATSFYVRFTPQANGLKSGNVTLAGGGANATLPVSGTGESIAAPIAIAATAVAGTGFTANWNAVSGATGYFLDVYTKVPGLVTETLAGWNCATATSASQTADVFNTSNTNNSSLNVLGFTPTLTYPSGPSGATGSPNPFSISTPGWDNGQDTKYWQVDVNTTGSTNITVSSLQGSSGTGPKDFKLQYKVGAAGAWADVTGGIVTLTTAVSAGNLTTWGALSDVALPSDANNQALVSLRWIMTSNTSINGATVASTGTSRISAIYIKGQVNGLINTYVQQNINVGNVTSYAVTGLNANTTYYYVVRATNGVSTSSNSNEISAVTNAAPTLTASALAAFGNVCINATAQQSFTITGSNLSTANVVVGPLSGYTFSTTTTGPFLPALTLTQPGGAYSQLVYVQFAPTAVQSYGGNFAVSGGGASSINVAASGAGVNTLATVAGGSASSITQTSATIGGSISATGCSSVTAYGIEYSTTAGFANGTGTAVASSNLSGGSFTAALSGLTAATTYYYHAYATNAGGTAYSTEQSFTTTNPNPVLSASTLTAFGNICVNTASAANTFTLTGSNLTTANVVVGPLTGYAFATAAGGPFLATLNITQPGGALSQSVFVQFTPTAIQSYNGNIPVSGGGAAASINVAATGAGISTPPAVVTGASSSITTTGATLAGTITANGCTAVSAYGVEYSTTNGFANGSGTAVISSNLSGGAFTSSLSGLSPATTYYYKAYATNSGGTTYGAQQSFTTSAPPPPQLTVSSLTAFGAVCVNGLVGPNTFTLTGANLASALITVGPLAGYSFSETQTGSFNNTIGIIQAGGSLSKTIYVKFNPTAVQSYNGSIPVAGGGAPTVYVVASGSGVNTPATVSTGAASNITTSAAVLAGSITGAGCSVVTAYGIEYSSINGFVNGSGTKMPSINLSGSAYSSNVSGLLQGATYYYKAYVTTSGGTAYGQQQSFTLNAIGAGFRIFPMPARPGETVKLTVQLADLIPGYYGLQFFDAMGRQVYVHNMNVQGDFIDRSITIPVHLPLGIYEVRLVNFEKELGRKRIILQ